MMPEFTPPQQDDMPFADFTSDAPKDRLWRYYGSQQAGTTVWKDTQGIWHSQLYPYLGGATYRTFVDGELISDTADDPDVGIATAQEVYLGGHSYPVDQTKADEL